MAQETDAAGVVLVARVVETLGSGKSGDVHAISGGGGARSTISAASADARPRFGPEPAGPVPGASSAQTRSRPRAGPREGSENHPNWNSFFQIRRKSRHPGQSGTVSPPTAPPHPPDRTAEPRLRPLRQACLAGPCRASPHGRLAGPSRRRQVSALQSGPRAGATTKSRAGSPPPGTWITIEKVAYIMPPMPPCRGRPPAGLLLLRDAR